MIAWYRLKWFLVITQKENVDNSLRLRHSRYRQTPILLKRVNAHAKRRELSTSVLAILKENFADFRMTRIKSGRSVLCPIIYLSP